MPVATFQACPVAGSACSVLWLLQYVSDPFYQNPPSCFNTDPAKPKQLQCLPKGFQSILPPETTETNFWTIRNSIFDNCSPTEGADAGCGTNLQCNYYKNDKLKRWTCEPDLHVVPKTKKIKASAKKSYELSVWHQTCGHSAFSSHLNNGCKQGSKKGKLICTPVSAYVNGVIGTKKICLTREEVEERKRLEKRAVTKAFCYSGCPAGQGYTKQI